jgi:hypothetical protein
MTVRRLQNLDLAQITPPRPSFQRRQHARGAMSQDHNADSGPANAQVEVTATARWAARCVSAQKRLWLPACCSFAPIIRRNSSAEGTTTDVMITNDLGLGGLEAFGG